MEQLTTRIGIEPGPGLVGRFGDTVIVIPRGDAGVSPAAAGVIQELLGLAAEVGSDREASANAIASRLAAWVIGHMSGDAPAFGIVAPMRDGVIMFLRGAVWCTITEGGATREVSGEQALTWVDLIVPGTFERLAIGAAAGPVQADPLSDLRGGVVPGQGFVLSRVAGTPGVPDIPGPEPAVAESVSASEPVRTPAACGGTGAGAGSRRWPAAIPAASPGRRPRRCRGRRRIRRRSPGGCGPRSRTTSPRWSCGPVNTNWTPAGPSRVRLRPFSPRRWHRRCRPARRPRTDRSAC